MTIEWPEGAALATELIFPMEDESSDWEAVYCYRNPNIKNDKFSLESDRTKGAKVFIMFYRPALVQMKVGPVQWTYYYDMSKDGMSHTAKGGYCYPNDLSPLRRFLREHNLLK
jgi:hypothetical protein